MNIADFVDRAARHFPDRPALIFEDNLVTYQQLAAKIDSTAHGMRASGIGRRDRVAMFLPNIPAFPIVYGAIQKIGAIGVSVNTMLTTEELAHILTDSGARAVFTTADLAPRLQPLAGRILATEPVFLCEGESRRYQSLSALQTSHGARFAAEEMDRDDPAAILYTSGTTGKQKGAVLSHGNVVSNVHATSHLLRIDPTDRLLLFLPLFHCFGQNFIMNAAFSSGAAVVLHRRFVPDQILDSIARDGVTMFFAVPTVYINLLNTGIQPDQLAGIRYYFSAAATMPIEIAERWRERFGRPIFEGYGLTETSPFASYNHEWGHRPGSVGTPIEMVEMRVVNEEDRQVGVGEWGEILIKGPNVMLGYWNRPEESAEALRGGWFHTGDIGYVDADGYLFLVDRVKDMINAAGFKVWPREVEEVLYQHPAVKECAVVGMPDPVSGEIATAFVIPLVESSLTIEELETHCREHLAVYKVPRTFELVAELPKSATGKILKRVLRDEATRWARQNLP